MLGDNNFSGHGLPKLLNRAVGRKTDATVFAYQVRIVANSGDSRVTHIEEAAEPSCRTGQLTGLYFYDNDVVRYASEVRPFMAQRTQDYRR